MNKSISQFINKRFVVVLILGFASGLPLGLTGATLQAWYTTEGVDVVTIGFLALVGQPYVYKFLWAPVVDKVSVPIIGRRRSWIMFSQLLIIGLLITMAFVPPKSFPLALGLLALSLAVCSATQDIAIDAYRTEILKATERGSGAAFAVAGYRIAMLVSGGLALVIAGYFGFTITYLLMAVTMLIGLVCAVLAKEPKLYNKPPPSFTAAFAKPFAEFFSRENALALLILIVLYKMGDAFAGTLTTTFLLRGVGFSLVDVGLINKTVGMAATLIGAFFGGYLLSKLGLYRSLMWFGILQAVTNGLFMLLAIMGKSYYLMVLTISLENLAGGMGTAAFLALIMTLCNPSYTATQFALLSALSAVGRVFVGPAAGFMVNSIGWIEFFFWTIIFSIPGLVLLWWLRGTIYSYEGDKNNLDYGSPCVNAQ